MPGRRLIGARNQTEETPDYDQLRNPLGLDGLEFVELSASETGVLEPGFVAMG